MDNIKLLKVCWLDGCISGGSMLHGANASAVTCHRSIENWEFVYYFLEILSLRPPTNYDTIWLILAGHILVVIG